VYGGAWGFEQFYGFGFEISVGLYNLNSVDPQLESAWVQPLNI
jgi:hypothetical protein